MEEIEFFKKDKEEEKENIKIGKMYVIFLSLNK